MCIDKAKLKKLTPLAERVSFMMQIWNRFCHSFRGFFGLEPHVQKPIIEVDVIPEGVRDPGLQGDLFCNVPEFPSVNALLTRDDAGTNSLVLTPSLTPRLSPLNSDEENFQTLREILIDGQDPMQEYEAETFRNQGHSNRDIADYFGVLPEYECLTNDREPTISKALNDVLEFLDEVGPSATVQSASRKVGNSAFNRDEDNLN